MKSFRGIFANTNWLDLNIQWWSFKFIHQSCTLSHIYT